MESRELMALVLLTGGDRIDVSPPLVQLEMLMLAGAALMKGFPSQLP